MSQRITRELSAEMARLRASDTPEARLPVVISVAPPPTTFARDIDALAAAVHAAQAAVVRRLEALGVGDVRRHAMASAVEAELTPDQIDDVAGESSVRSVTLNGPLDVTM